MRGLDVEKEYEDIIRVKGYLNHVKEVAIRLLNDNYNIAAVVQYVISIEEKYSEIVKKNLYPCASDMAEGVCVRTYKSRNLCPTEKKYDNISFNEINVASNVKNDLSSLNISKTLPVRSHTLVMSKGWERFICGIKNDPQCYLELNEKGVYIVNTDAKHIPHLTKYEYEDLGLRIAGAPLGHPMQRNQCNEPRNKKRYTLLSNAGLHHYYSRYLVCNADQTYRNCQENFTLSGEPFIFTNPKRRDPYHIRKETFPKDSVLYISGPRTLTAAANYPAVMYIPDSYVQYVGSKNNETIFIINGHTSGTLEGGVEKENTVVMNLRTEDILVDLSNEIIAYDDYRMNLINTYNYVSDSSNRKYIITHCKTKFINAKNSEIRQESFYCQDQDYEIRVVNEKNVHHRGLKQAIFVVNENSDNARIISDF